MELSPVAAEEYERLTANYNEAERRIFARGVLVGTKNLVDKTMDLLASEGSDTDKVDVLMGQMGVISLALMISGVEL